MSEQVISHPWDISHCWFENNYHIQKQYHQALWNLLTFEQESWQANMIQSYHWMYHCLSIASKPNIYFRYLRRNWQKPLLEVSSQMLTTTYLFTRLWSQSWYDLTQGSATKLT